jgi:hypothetical protein
MSKKYTTIRVEQTDIDQALRKKSGRCVVATAMARSIDGAHHVDVDMQTVRFTVDGERRVYLTPPAAVGYVVAFDAGDDIHPFAFRLSEGHRVSVRQDKMTPAGAERKRTRNAVARAKEKKERAQLKLDEVTAQPDPDPVDVAEAEAIAKKATRDVAKTVKEHEANKEQLAGEPYREPDMTPDPGTGERRRKPPARAFRTNTRAYGNRTLRINQDKPTPENVAARDSVMAVYNEGT